MLNNFFWVYPGVISGVLCDYMVKSAPWKDKYSAELSKDNKNLFVDDDIRKTEVTFTNPYTPLGCMLQTYTNLANKEAGWNFDITDFEQIQIGKYEDGGHYDWHIDSFTPDAANKQRKLSAVAFLSDPDTYEGGVFEFKIAALPEKMPKGTLIVFPSVLEHRVTAVDDGIRYTAACWASGPAFR
jgi:PKHD-type hydroxylase